jgi:hypothetical protein
MIAPAKRRLAKPRPTQARGYSVEYRVDHEAEPGDVLPSLARLLIGLARQQRATESLQQQTSDGNGRPSE